jgi:CheY-like chemotaxis protein
MEFRSTDRSGRRVVVADEDAAVVAFIIRTLRSDGHAVFHAYDGLSAVELVLALEHCDLLISNTKVDGMAGVDLIRRLRKDRPDLAILYLANQGRSTPEIERQLPEGVPILREPFSADDLRASIGRVFDGPR